MRLGEETDDMQVGLFNSVMDYFWNLRDGMSFWQVVLVALDALILAALGGQLVLVGSRIERALEQNAKIMTLTNRLRQMATGSDVL